MNNFLFLSAHTNTRKVDDCPKLLCLLGKYHIKQTMMILNNFMYPKTISVQNSGDISQVRDQIILFG